MDLYEDDYNYDYEESFGDERAAFERTGMGGLESDIKDTPEEYFERLVSIFLTNNLFSEYILDKDTVLKNIEKSSKVKYLNPYCYVFGYLCLKFDRNSYIIDKENVKRSFSLLERGNQNQIQEIESIKTPDILRYAQYISNLLNN